jgi:hypothetical protein
VLKGKEEEKAVALTDGWKGVGLGSCVERSRLGKKGQSGEGWGSGTRGGSGTGGRRVGLIGGDG